MNKAKKAANLFSKTAQTGSVGARFSVCVLEVALLMALAGCEGGPGVEPPFTDPDPGPTWSAEPARPNLPPPSPQSSPSGQGTSGAGATGVTAGDTSSMTPGATPPINGGAAGSAGQNAYCCGGEGADSALRDGGEDAGIADSDVSDAVASENGEYH
jgi:hypothetical protein